MRTLASALSAAYAAAVQRPAWLVEIVFPSAALRLSSFETVTWNSATWTAGDVRCDQVALAGLDVRGTVTIGNADDAIAALVLTDGVAGRPVRIWGYDAGAVSGGSLAADVPVYLVDAVGSGASISEREARIGLRSPWAYASTPRERVGAPRFTVLLPAGRKIDVAGNVYEIRR